MAIASVGTLGTGASSTSASSFTLTTATNSLASGDFAIMTVVTDNVSTSTGETNDHRRITGATGKWLKLYEYTYSPTSAAADGITTSAWLFFASASLPTSTVLTISLGAAVVDKAATFWKYTKGAGTSIRLVNGAVNPIVRNTLAASVGYGSVSFSGMASGARLYYRALGKEANIGTSGFTPSTNFTAHTMIRSRNNASAVGAVAEHRINTSTGETSNPTLAVSGDSIGIFLALEEYTPSGSGDLLVRWEASTSTCFKNATCTTAVTADGDEVLGIKDTSSGAILQTWVAGSGPLYRTGGGKPYLENDGTKIGSGNQLVTLGDSTGKYMYGYAARFDDFNVDGNGSGPGAIHFSNQKTNLGSGNLFTGLRVDAGGVVSCYAYDEAAHNGTDLHTGASLSINTNTALSGRCDGNNIEVYIDNSSDGSGSNAGFGNPIIAGCAYINLFGSWGFINRFKGRLYGFRLYLGDNATTHTSMVTALQALYPAAQAATFTYATILE
jgi:hypothetical protein